MTLEAHHGADDHAILRARQAAFAGHAHETFDLTDPDRRDAALDALTTTSLFGGPRRLHLTDPPAATDPWWDRFAAAAATTTATVVVTADTLTPTQIRRLEAAGGTVTKHTVARGRDLDRMITDEARTAGITLGADTHRLIATRCGDAPDRIRSIITSLALAGLTRPKLRQVEALTGTAASDPKPWDVTDAAEAGRGLDALRAAHALDAIPTIGWITRRILDLAAVVEADATTPAAVAAIVGGPDWKAKPLAALARRVTGADTHALIDAALDADEAAKTGQPAAAVARLVATYTATVAP